MSPRWAVVGLLALSCSSTPKTDAGQGGGGGASADGQSCQQSAVEFRLEASDASAWFFYDSAQGCAPAGWLSLRDAAGSEIAIGNPILHCCALANCGSCRPDTVCQTGWTTPALPVSRTWDATLFPFGHCGADQTACVMESACAPAGRYEAHMCAHRMVNDQDQMSCVDVPFDLPAAGPVVGTVPQ